MSKYYQIKDYDCPIDHHPVDDIEPEEAEHIEAFDAEKLSEALIAIVAWSRCGVTCSSIAARVHILAEILGLNQQSVSWSEIAKVTKLTRSAVQLMAKELEQQFGLRSANARKNETREKCKLAQISKNK